MTDHNKNNNEYTDIKTDGWYKDFVDNTHDLIQCVDSEGRFIYVNQTWLSTLNYNAEEIANITLWDIIHPASMEHCMAAFKQVFKGKYPGEIEAVFAAKDGTPILVEGNISVKFDENGRFVHTRDIFRDVTSSKQMEEALREKRAFQDILLDLAVGFINVPPVKFDTAINDMLRKVGEFTNLDRVYLFEHDHLRRVTFNTREWCREGIASGKDILQEHPFDFFPDFLETWAKGEIVHIPSVSQMPKENIMRTVLEEQDIKSLVLIPLMQDKGNIGFVGLDAVNECKSFSEREISLLRVLAEIISNAFARKQAEEELGDLKSFNENIVQNIAEGIIINDLDGIITFANPALLKMLGYSAEEFIGNHYTFFVPPQHHDLIEAAYFRRLEGKTDRYELLLKHNNGTLLPFQVGGSPYYDHTTREISGIMAVLTDISERKQAEEDLKASEQKYREILSTMEEGYYEVDLTGNFVFFNESLCRQSGYSSNELMGESYKRFYKNPDEVFKTYSRVYKTGKPETAVDWPVITSDGRTIYVEVSISLRRDEKGEPIGFRGVARDITQRRQAEERIRYLSFHDQLTGLYNRHFLEVEMERFNTERQLPISIIMADLNGLKLVNDTYGHYAGDEMLKRVAAILKGVCREDDLIARFGGDEFVLYLPRTPENEALKISSRIEESCRKEQVNNMPLSLSSGVAVKISAEQELPDVLREAEDNMYQNKLTESRSGKSAIVSTLLKTLAEKSFETEAHTRNMQEAAIKIGEKLGLPNSELHRLHLLITLHDIGKINLPEYLLTKMESLDKEELEVLKKHCEIGYRIARASGDFAHVAEDILAHHERWDGSGYPQGLKGEEIPLLARIATLVDAYEVMSNGRPYKKAMQLQAIKTELKKSSGTQFDPKLVELFLSILETEG